jgi:ABC-2 type transport system ATP-binding protein
MSAIEIQNLKKYFGNIKAVDDISLSVKEGEVFGYLGPNGAGKSTTIFSMMSFIKPTAGTISMLGKDAFEDRVELKRRIGFLSSDVYLYKNLTGQQHIDLVQAIRGKAPILRKLLKDFEFDPTMKVDHLSTGTKQKLGVIMSFMHKPSLLLLDEPTRGLDPLLQNMVYQYIDEFKKQGITIFMSSHNLSEVEKLCDRVGILKSGKLLAIETMSSLKQKRIHEVKVFFKKVPDESVFEIKGVVDMQKINDHGMSFKVKGDIGPVVKTLCAYDLYDLEVSHASLEDIFLEFYK